MGKNNQHHKERRIKIVDPKKIDYTYISQDNPFEMKSSLDNEKYRDTLNKSETEKKDIDRIRYDITKNAKIRTKGRLIGGQSKQSHSSVYE
jgi:hypothetical protein